MVEMQKIHIWWSFIPDSVVKIGIKSFYSPLPPHLPIVFLNFEQTIVGISICIHFRTVAANSNNFQTHPVCNLLSTNEINPSENIFNNNVVQNGISKIVEDLANS